MEQRGNRARAEEANFTVRPGSGTTLRPPRTLVQSAEEHTVYDPSTPPPPDAEKVMRRFLADLSSSSHSCLFVAERTLKSWASLRELREGSPAFKPKTWAAVEAVYSSRPGAWG